MKGVFGSRMEMKIPDLDKPGRILWGGRVLRVGGNEKLWKLCNVLTRVIKIRNAHIGKPTLGEKLILLIMRFLHDLSS